MDLHKNHNNFQTKQPSVIRRGYVETRIKTVFFSFVIFIIYFSQINAEQNITPTAAAESASLSIAPFSAHYKVSKGVMTVGKSTRTFSKTDDGRFIFESITKPAGIAKLFTSGKVTERSEWKYENSHFVPITYIFRNSDNDSKRDVQLHFNWDEHIVTNVINGDPWKMEIEPNTQDKLLYQLLLMHELRDGKTKFSYNVADGGKLKTYEMTVSGEEVLKTEIGIFKTIKVTRETDKRKTTLWCASEIQFVPVRIEQENDDGSITAVITSLQGIAIPESAKIPETKSDAK